MERWSFGSHLLLRIESCIVLLCFSHKKSRVCVEIKVIYDIYVQVLHTRGDAVEVKVDQFCRQ